MGKLSRREKKRGAVGVIIADALADRRWLQAELADILGVSDAYVSAIIVGKKRISAETAKALSAALGCDASALLKAQTVEWLNAHPMDEKVAEEIRSRALAMSNARMTAKPAQPLVVPMRRA